MATGNKKIIDICLEVCIGVIMTAAVSVLSGIRSDLNELNIKMSTIVEKVSEHETRFQDEKETIRLIENRIRELELKGRRVMR